MAQPRRIGDVLAQVIARRGYAREQSTAAIEGAWRQIVASRFAKFTRAGAVRRGTLEVFVANNLVAQELGFSKEELIERLARLAPEQNVKNIRFRVGPIN